MRRLDRIFVLVVVIELVPYSRLGFEGEDEEEDEDEEEEKPERRRAPCRSTLGAS